MSQNTEMAKAMGILNDIDFQVSIKSKKKGRPFIDTVIENSPEQFISTKRSVFRSLKRYLQNDFSEKPCNVTVPGVIKPDLSF